jgi:hypothetical protein
VASYGHSHTEIAMKQLGKSLNRGYRNSDGILQSVIKVQEVFTIQIRGAEVGATGEGDEKTLKLEDRLALSIHAADTYGTGEVKF